MEWLQSLTDWAGAAFDQAGMGLLAVPIALLLGLLSAVASVCCTLPVLGVIVGYAGTKAETVRRERYVSAGFFFLGTVLSLVILGVVAAGVGQVAQASLGKYWKLFAGFVVILMGLGTLQLLPIRMPHREKELAGPKRKGMYGALLFGLVGGGAVSVCSLACNPGIFIIVGAALLQGITWWMVAILVAYACGFALPFGAIMLGVSMGTASVKAKKAETIVRIVSGVVLIGVGFYFLSTF